MARFPVNFPLILSMLMPMLLLGNVFAIDPQRSEVGVAEVPQKLQLCNFNKDTRTYNSTDLLMCLYELASNIFLDEKPNPNGIAIDRAYQDTRQSYPVYQSAPHYPISSNGAASSNYYGDDTLSSLLSGGLPLPNLSNLLNFGSFMRSGSSLFDALSSIAQHDDLKCVPRILCEVASGSMPGNLAYRQSSTFPNFGQNALFGLLTAFDAGGTSPLLSFGKAALLGYTNKGQPQTCYQEYSRCPRNSNQLISYLNNHNGGFFRFFSANRGSYYRPQQSTYQPYYKNSVQYRIVQSKPAYPLPQTLFGPEADRTGTKKLIFAESDYDDQDSGNANNNNFFSAKLRDSDSSSRVIFPKEKRENHFESNRIIKSFHVFNDANVNKVRQESLRKDRRFFPQEDENQNNINAGYINQIHYNRRPRTETFGNKGNYVYFPHDSVQMNTPILTFPSHFRDY